MRPPRPRSASARSGSTSKKGARVDGVRQRTMQPRGLRSLTGCSQTKTGGYRSRSKPGPVDGPAVISGWTGRTALLTLPLPHASPGAVARFSQAVPCVQVTFEREIRRVHALPRAPARAGGAASRPRRARAHRERRCGAHTDAREQPSASQQLAPSEHRSRRIRRDPRDPRVGPRGAAAPHATPAESAGATERLLRPPGRVIIGPLDGAADHGPRCHMDQDDDHAARRRCGARNHAPPAGVHALSLRRRLREAVGAEISI